ncbi:transcriptional regulator [Enterococcus florum]|uniref:Transcriptional regulator n=1 Tax=Enterococcus florum TaxID=2480627 RepID=A0A4P5PCV5_9ENTE|nr:helix-turn-helix domain-containing protein [Enterococcus florum]GCF95696.1 transcriptional regulator [Enterococcus florum]
MQIVIITKNVLAEQQLELQLQRLNHEVYVTSRLLSAHQPQSFLEQIIDHFQIIVLSESFSDTEVNWIVQLFNPQKHTVFRKGDKPLKKADEEYWREQGIQGWIQDYVGFEPLRELIDQVNQRFTFSPSTVESGANFKESPLEIRRNAHALKECHFKYNERKIINALMEGEGRFYSREDMCRILWENEPNSSKMAQLSLLIRKTKQRFLEIGIREEIIQTTWGKGYRLTDAFYEYFPFCEAKETESVELRQ